MTSRMNAVLIRNLDTSIIRLVNEANKIWNNKITEEDIAVRDFQIELYNETISELNRVRMERNRIERILENRMK